MSDIKLTSIVPKCNNCKRSYSWYYHKCPDCKQKDIPTAVSVLRMIKGHWYALMKDLIHLICPNY